MMSRDDIIEAVRVRVFSFRFKFWTDLEEHCWVRVPGKQEIKVAWPWALTMITLEQWNATYKATEDYFASDRGAE